jgi:hypothetical protein
MPWYHVRCAAARLRGAIGRFSLEYERLEAVSPADAERQYRDKYETQGPPVVAVQIAVPPFAYPDPGGPQPMKLSLYIECDNAAFDPDAGQEVARILHKLAASVQHGLTQPGGGPLHDVNGNRVGRWGFGAGDGVLTRTQDSRRGD